MISIDHIEDARQVITKELRTTPLVPSGIDVGQACFLKLENMQKTGSFKERGALHKLSKLKSHGSVQGIVAASAGNHAQAVAFHGVRLGFSVTIIMPKHTALNKIMSTKRWGAHVRLEGESFDEAIAIAQEVSKKEKRTFIHAFDDEEVIAGQGTLGLELLDQNPQIQTVIVPVGGGGLACGVAIALKEKNPSIKVIGVAAESYPHTFHSFKNLPDTLSPKGETKPMVPTLGDGISMKNVGEITLPLLRKYVDDMVTVTEEEMADAILYLLENSKILAEGAGAASLAALQSGKIRGLAGNVVAIVSGGNIDVTLISRIIEKGMAKSGRLARLNVIIQDRPGGLKALATLLAEQRANVLQIQHERASHHVPLYDTGTDLTLETRGAEHIEEILKALADHGYRVEVKD